jgi:hypothetical protein
METLKISPSILDNYRTCLHGKFGKSIKDFIEGLDKPWEKTEAQSKGDAYHKLLEHGGCDFFNIDFSGKVTYKVHEPDLKRDWIFTEAQAKPALDTFTDFPNKQHEVWGRLELEILGHPIRMNLRVDALEVPMIWDYKTTGKPPRAENYSGTTQWPLYMMAYPECTAFRYRVFHLTDYGCEAHDYLFERSVQHERVAIQWLTHLVDFIITNNLQPKFALK